LPAALKHCPSIHGHRGARGRRPENTLAAVEYALRHGADGVEVDLCITADDAVVVHHDLRLNPDTTRDARGRWVTGRAPIRALKRAELRRFDVGRLRPGSVTALRFAGQTPVDGARIPLLEEFVDWMAQRGAGATLNLECKSDPRQPELAPPPGDYAARVADELARLRPVGPIFLQSFDWALVAALKQAMQRRQLPCKTGFTTPRPLTPARLQAARDAGVEVFSCDYRGLTQTLLHQARDMGLEVCAWTVNAEADIARMAEWGVDTVTTDYPERARKLPTVDP